MCFVIVGLLLGTAAVAPAQGLKGEYFKGTSRDFVGAPALTRTEPVDFDWVGGEPAVGFGVDNFSIRWTGSITAPATGTYIFRVWIDDGARVWLNDNLIIDSWVDQAATWHASGEVDLKAGTTYPIKVEFYEVGGEARVRLFWRYPG
jgi:hypothetical protein